MVLGIDLLLQGPRGRRLCLELAMELDQEVRTAAFWLAYGFDNGRGTSRVLLTAVSSGNTPADPPCSVPGVVRGEAGVLELLRPQ